MIALNIEYITVTLEKSELEEFGFCYDEHNTITKIDKYGSADMNGEIRVGDKIHAINNICVTPSNNVETMLRNSGPFARVKVRRVKVVHGNKDVNEIITNYSKYMLQIYGKIILFVIEL